MGNKNTMESHLDIESLRASYDSSLNYWNDILRDKFGYIYDKDYRLKKVNPQDENDSFTFVNQKHYEALGDVVLEYIQELMRRKFEMKELFLPLPDEVGPDYSGPYCNVFISKDWGFKQKGLVLIQGAGAVRAGQWARSVCINDSLKTGSVIPFLEYAEQEGFSVIVLNPNFNRDSKTGKSIVHNESGERHCNYVWKKLISSVPEELYVVGHSCGGLCTVSLLKTFDQEFMSKVKAIALTDSVHFGVYQCSREAQKYFKEVTVDWVASNAPLDVLIRDQDKSSNGCINLSSGHYKHEYTTGSCYESIFKFFSHVAIEKYNPFIYGGYKTESLGSETEEDAGLAEEQRAVSPQIISDHSEDTKQETMEIEDKKVDEREVEGLYPEDISDIRENTEQETMEIEDNKVDDAVIEGVYPEDRSDLRENTEQETMEIEDKKADERLEDLYPEDRSDLRENTEQEKMEIEEKKVDEIHDHMDLDETENYAGEGHNPTEEPQNAFSQTDEESKQAEEFSYPSSTSFQSESCQDS